MTCTINTQESIKFETNKTNNFSNEITLLGINKHTLTGHQDSMCLNDVQVGIYLQPAPVLNGIQDRNYQCLS